MRAGRFYISQFGVYPPPYGGVSVHIQRLQALLLRCGYRCAVYDFSRYNENKNDTNIINMYQCRNWLHILHPRGNIIHIHQSGMNSLGKILLLSILYNLMGKSPVVTYHSLKEEITDIHSGKKLLFRISDLCISHYIGVSPQIRNKLISFGIETTKISTIPAFLPPVVKQSDIETIPEDVWNFIKRHKPILSANASGINFFRDQDLYGIDMCIELCANLKIAYPEIGFVFCLPDIGNLNYFREMKENIRMMGIENNFCFVTHPVQFYPILMKSDAYVRPTNTDGDAISIREAAFFKIPAVASDAVPRPPGTVLFRNRDITHLTQKINEVLMNRYERRVSGDQHMNANFSMILNVYSSVLKGKHILYDHD